MPMPMRYRCDATAIDDEYAGANTGELGGGVVSALLRNVGLGKMGDCLSEGGRKLFGLQGFWISLAQLLG
jgi:hypothetical protein